MSETAIEVKNLSKSFVIPHEQRTSLKSYFLSPFRKVNKSIFYALNNVSLTINKGEFVAIMGRNGSGKSTLLKMIAQIYTPDSGKVKVHGRLIPFLELGVGFNPQLSGRENIYLNGTILGMTRKYLKENFDSIVDYAEVREFIDLPLKNYSSGMMVRLAFSIAIKAEADIYLLDEVLAVGDINFQQKSLKSFVDLINKGKTILYVSHNFASVKEYCKRAILIERGEVKFDGDLKKAEEIYTELMAQS